MSLYGHLARLFALFYISLKSYRLVSFLLVHCLAFASLMAMLNITLPSHFFLSYSGDEIEISDLDPSAGRICFFLHFDMTSEKMKARLEAWEKHYIRGHNNIKYFIISADESTLVAKMLIVEGGYLQVPGCLHHYFHSEAFTRYNHSIKSIMSIVNVLPYKTLFSDVDFYTQPTQTSRILTASQQLYLLYNIYSHFPQVKLCCNERVRPFTHRIDGYFLAHLDVTIKVICLLVAFSLSPLRLVYLFHRDLTSGFVDTLQSGQGTSVQLYLLAQFTSSFFLCHLLLIGFSARVLLIELDLIYSLHALLVLVCALILLSVETHLTANLATLLLGKLSPVVLGLMLMPLQYLLLVSEFEPRTSLRFHQNPELYGFCHAVLFAIAPYMAFETFLMALIENSSRARVQISETYSINSHHNEATLWLTLAAYLAVIVLRAVACLLIYRLGWDNLHERTLLSCLPESIAKRFSRKQPSSHASPHSAKKHSALVLSSVFKRVPRSRNHLQDVNLALNYGTLTALYHSSSDVEAVAVLCKLLAGFHRPDSGQVRHGQCTRIAYVLPCDHLPECFNVKEYFYLLGQMHRFLYNSTAEYKHQLHRVLRFLQLEKDDALKWQASELTAFERTKVFIGQAVMARANVILLNSPSSSNLEWEEKRQLWSLISSLKRNRAIFVATNSLQEAEFLADNLFVFTKGQIKPRLSTGSKADSREQLVLRISRKSKSSRHEVENLFSQCQVAITSTRASASEFVFYCELPKKTEKQKKEDKHVLRMLDTLMEKTKAGDVLVNGLAVNPTEDALEEMESHSANVGQATEERACPRRAPSRHPFLANLRLMLWKRLLIASHRPSLFLAAFLLTLSMFLLPLFCAQFILKVDKSFYEFTAASLLQSGKVSVSMSNNLSATSILRQFCQHPNFQRATSAGCEVLPPGVAYHEWIYRNAKTFHDYAQNYFFNIGLERESANGYVMNAFFNDYSKRVNNFAMDYYGNMLLNELLQDYQLTYLMSDNSSIVFQPGTNPLEFLFAASFFSLTTLLLYFLAGNLFCRSVLISETCSGVRHLQRASQVAPLPYYLADLITSAVYVLLAYLPLYLLGEVILGPQVVHPLLRGSLDDCVWFLVFITSIITLASAWSHLLVTYPGLVLIIVQFVGPLLIKSLFFVLAVASFAVLPPTLYIILNELLILPSPENILALWGESLLAHVYNTSVAMRQEFGNNSNMVAHYEHFWSASSIRYLLQMVAYHCIFALIIALEDFRQYREKSEKRLNYEAIIVHDGSVGKEKLTVENMVKSGVWPEDVVLLVHQLSRFKARSIDDVSFTIRRGQCLAIVALKDAGKSTLAGILTGRVPFNKGNFYLEQFDEATHPCKQLDGIGFAPQFDCVHESLTVQEMLMLFAKIRRVYVGHIWGEVRRAAAIFQLADHLGTTGSQLNVATKRATTLAIAFIGAPSLVILDDPTHQLDLTEKLAIWSMLHAAKTASKAAILLTTSLLEEAQSLSDRIGIMIHGDLCYLGTELKLRQEHCPGYQLYIKISPERGSNMQYLFQLRQAFGTNFVGIGALQMTKHFMLYYLPQESIVKGKKPQMTLSGIFCHLEQLRRRFDLEAYTITIGSLEQLFLQYVPRYHALFKVKSQSQLQ